MTPTYAIDRYRINDPFANLIKALNAHDESEGIRLQNAVFTFLGWELPDLTHAMMKTWAKSVRSMVSDIAHD